MAKKTSELQEKVEERIESGDYTSRQIQVLKGLEAVRKRPAMYIGTTGPDGLHHLVYEVVDNSIDEAMAGYCTRVEVTIHEDDSITVSDDGRGIPVNIHPTEGVSGVELAMTTLHAGGKFDKQSYKVSGGLHGVGVSVVNALAEWLQVEVKRDGHVWTQRYERGLKVDDLQKGEATDETGTRITFRPDSEIFTVDSFNRDTLMSRLREMAYLNRGTRITLRDERPDEPLEKEFHYEGGIVEFVKYLRGNKSPLHDDVIYVEGMQEDVEVELAMQYTDGYNEDTFTFVNNINTHEGGTHLTGFKAALTRTINNYADKNNLLKKGDPNLSGDDVREGLTAVLSVKVMEPQFEGQTKTKLGNSEVRGIVESLVNDKLATWLDENPSAGRSIIDKAVQAARAREAARKARDLTRKRSALETGILPGKLSDCSVKDLMRHIELPLLGRFNAENVLAASAALLACGLDARVHLPRGRKNPEVASAAEWIETLRRRRALRRRPGRPGGARPGAWRGRGRGRGGRSSRACPARSGAGLYRGLHAPRNRRRAGDRRRHVPRATPPGPPTAAGGTVMTITRGELDDRLAALDREVHPPDRVRRKLSRRMDAAGSRWRGWLAVAAGLGAVSLLVVHLANRPETGAGREFDARLVSGDVSLLTADPVDADWAAHADRPDGLDRAWAENEAVINELKQALEAEPGNLLLLELLAEARQNQAELIQVAARTRPIHI